MSLQEAAMVNEDFVIRPPTTTGDDAKPSGSLLRDVRRVLALIEDERLFAAHGLYCDVFTRLEAWRTQKSQQQTSPSRKIPKALRLSSKRNQQKAVHTEDHEHNAADDLLNMKKKELEKLKVRTRDVG